jgi:pimeloyl-ACP methyl ester carboxylesterase
MTRAGERRPDATLFRPFRAPGLRQYHRVFVHAVLTATRCSWHRADRRPRSTIVSDIFVDTWGTGTPVVLIHGSLATGAEEWEAQRPLAAEGFRLLVLDRRGYGRSPAAPGEDFLRDADDIAELMGNGAHLVGHSYGGLGALIAASRRLDATLSLTLLEPGAFGMGQHHADARALADDIRQIWDLDLPDEAWVVRFLRAVGSDPDAFPPEFLAAARPLVPVLRHGRPPLNLDLPLAELAAAPWPKLVVSGGHSAGFDAICDDVATRIGARRLAVAGAGHEVQFTGPPLNDALLALWRTVAPPSTRPAASV